MLSVFYPRSSDKLTLQDLYLLLDKMRINQHIERLEYITIRANRGHDADRHIDQGFDLLFGICKQFEDFRRGLVPKFMKLGRPAMEELAIAREHGSRNDLIALEQRTDNISNAIDIFKKRGVPRGYRC